MHHGATTFMCVDRLYMSMPRQVVRQGSCTECDEDEDNFTVTNSETSLGEDSVSYETRCTCGETGSVTIDDNGISETVNISHDNASWNEDDEEVEMEE